MVVFVGNDSPNSSDNEESVPGIEGTVDAFMEETLCAVS